MRGSRLLVFFAAVTLCWVGARLGFGAPLTADSPEVKDAIEKAIKFLESDAAGENRLGAKALVGLTLLKAGREADHPRITQAVAAIQNALRDKQPADLGLDIYSTGLSAIFLITLDPSKYAPEITALLAYLQSVQKDHGGWGYKDKPTGDTSMTQYGVLASWEAAQVGFKVPHESIEKVTKWLMRTQDPSGAFGYQGNVSESGPLVKQQGIRLSMVAAGLGSTYICANLLGLSARIERDEELPKALRPVQAEAAVPKTTINAKLLRETQMHGNAWLRSNFKIDPDGYTHYYLYALERYYSFREAAEGERDSKWYSDGAAYLIRTQAENGSWTSKCTAVPDTSFGTLFLLRSAKKSIEHARYYKAGLATGNRGLPRNTTRVVAEAGRLVARPVLESPEKLLAALADPDSPQHVVAIESLAAFSTAECRQLAADGGERLRQFARQGSAPVRAAAVRALGRSGDTVWAPAAIRALSDSDPAVVREAIESLSRLSRRPLTAAEIDAAAADPPAAIRQWKDWYRAIRPNAQFEDE